MNLKLATYIANYINEELDRTRANPTTVMIQSGFVDEQMILSAVEAYQGGAR